MPSNRVKIGLPPSPRFTWDAPPPDRQPTLSQEPGFFAQLPDRLKRGFNTVADALLGSTPEEQAQVMVESAAGPLGTAQTAGRRMMRPLLSGDLTGLLPGRQKPPPLREMRLGVRRPVNAPLTPEERRIVRTWDRDRYLQETPFRRYDEPAWDDAQDRMGNIMEIWKQHTSPWVRKELNDIVTNTEFGRHYLTRLHGLLQEAYPSGRVPLYRGLGWEELEKILTFDRVLRSRGEMPIRGGPDYSPWLQSFSLSPNMARRFAGTERGVLHGEVPIENIRGHMRQPTMQEEELIVDVLPRRRELLPDWKVVDPASLTFKPQGSYPNWGKTRMPEYWQNLMKQVQ
jgi:hypothetical protein